MTLAEIRERYGVPAEVGMLIEDPAGDLGRIIGCTHGYGMVCVHWVDRHGEDWETSPKDLTYYNDDGEVIWRPE